MTNKGSFRILSNEEYPEMFRTCISNSNHIQLVRNEVIQSLVHTFTGIPFDLMSIGAGVGWLEDDIIKHPELTVSSILAIEPSTEYAEKLKEKSVDWVDTQCTIDTSHFDENYETAIKFDVILMAFSIYYSKSPINSVIKAKSFLKPGGKVLIVMRGDKGGLELASCLHQHVKIDPTICTYNWEGSVQLIEGLNKSGIKYQINNFTCLYDVTDFIERNDNPTRNYTISFFLHTKYEDLDKELQDDLYKIVKDRVTVSDDNKQMFNHTNSLVIVENN